MNPEIERLKAEIARVQAERDQLAPQKAQGTPVPRPNRVWSEPLPYVWDQTEVQHELARWDAVLYLLRRFQDLNNQWDYGTPEWKTVDQYTWIDNQLHSLEIMAEGQRAAAARRIAGYKSE